MTTTLFFTRYLQCFRDVGPSYIVTKPTSGLCELDFGISESFHDTVSRTPRAIFPHLGCAHHTVLEKQTPATLRSGL